MANYKRKSLDRQNYEKKFILQQLICFCAFFYRILAPRILNPRKFLSLRLMRVMTPEPYIAPFSEMIVGCTTVCPGIFAMEN